MSTLTRITLGRLQSPSGGPGVVAGFVGASLQGSDLAVALGGAVVAGITDAGVRAIVSPELAASFGAPVLTAALVGAIVAEVD